jgi:hypothetical protein
MLRRTSLPICVLSFCLGCGLPPTPQAVPSKGSAESFEDAMRDGKVAFQPVLAALEEYHARFGRYPEKLDALVEDGLIDQLPAMPHVSGARSQVMGFQSDAATDFYHIYFIYDMSNYVGGSNRSFYYISDEGQWKMLRVPPFMCSLVAERAGKAFREHRLSKHLDAFFDNCIEGASPSGNCANLLKDCVDEDIGEGEPGEIGGKKGVIYRSGEAHGKVYFVTFKTKRFDSWEVKSNQVVGEVLVFDPSRESEGWVSKVTCE